MPEVSKVAIAASASAACLWASGSLFVQPGATPPALRSTSSDAAVAFSSDDLATASSGGMTIAPAACIGTAALAMSGLARSGQRGRRVVRAAAETAKPVFDPAAQIGAMAPMGYFDPIGLCKKGDEAGFRNLRAAEIKHGRVAMMAAVGAVAQHFLKLPGFEKVPAGLSAVTTEPGSYGFALLFVVSGALELGLWTEGPNKEPGNFGDPAGLNQYNEGMRQRELNNGRFAMFAALGIVAAELLTGKDAVQQFGI